MGREDLYFTTATPEHIEELTQFLGEIFLQEPATQGCSEGEPLTLEDWTRFCRIFVPGCCSSGISPIAIDKETGVSHNCS